MAARFFWPGWSAGAKAPKPPGATRRSGYRASASVSATISLAHLMSDNPNYLVWRERIDEGLRMAGVLEG